MTESNTFIFDALDYRHWDTWNDGNFNHVILTNNQTQKKTDLLQDEPYYSPQMPFGGSEDYVWSPDSKKVIYVSKKKSGTEYALSTKDRKSTRLNSSHVRISYAVFCLK